MSKGAHVHEDVLWGKRDILNEAPSLLCKAQTCSIRTDGVFYC